MNINISLAQNLYPISVAVIPATPAGPVSPLRTPTSGGLYPNHRSPTRLPVAVDPDWGILEKDSWVALKETVFGPGWWKLAIPSILFVRASFGKCECGQLTPFSLSQVFQANAQYLASGNLSVPTFQLAYQLKVGSAQSLSPFVILSDLVPSQQIPATALCSVLLLNRVLSPQQWISLFILTLGVGIVQLHSAAPAPHLPSSPATPLNLDSHPAPNPVLGLVAVMAACLSSGFASTYFERMLKKPASSTDENEGSQSQPSLWIRNIQLSLFGLAAGLPIVWYEMQGGWTKGDDGRSLSLEGGWMGGAMETSRVLAGSFFEGFDEMTWAVIGLQVMGGLLAGASLELCVCSSGADLPSPSALVMQHADNIAKCFSTSISIILSFIASVYLFNFHVRSLPPVFLLAALKHFSQVSFGVAFGASLVLLSTWAYAQPASWRSRARGASRPTPLLNGEGAAAK